MCPAAPESPEKRPLPSGGRRLRVPDSLDGARLDKALVVLAQVSRWGAKALLEAGVRVNGRRAPKGSVVRTGDELELSSGSFGEGGEGESGERDGGDKADLAALPDPEVEVEVLLERPDVLVVQKPPRLASAPLAAGERGTLANGLVARYPELAGVGDDKREPGLLHRLDNDTSGLLVVARTRAAYGELRDALKHGAIEKRYLCVVAPGVGSSRAASVPSRGELPEQGSIDFPLAPHPKDRRRVFACVHPRDVQRLSPRPASTSYHVLRRFLAKDGTARALVEATASKALRHQIRVHFAAIGAPLVGDGLYGGPAAPEIARHALHASRVAYRGGAAVSGFVVEAPLPDDLSVLLPPTEPEARENAREDESS